MTKRRSAATRIKDVHGSPKIAGRNTISRTGTRGASVQGALQNAKGANAGANQGGAPRGASRLEPSTTKKGTGRVSGKRQTQKGRGRISA
jgi:hypothetical protein